MTLAAAWVLFPAALLAVTTGWGLLVQAAAGGRVPAALLPALGLCALALALTATSRLAPGATLALITTIGGALAGAALWVGRRRGIEAGAPAALWPAVLAGLAAFALLAAPVVLSGHPALSGYIRLDDTATFLALADWVLAHGNDTSGLAPSTYEATLRSYLDSGYPTSWGFPLVAVGRMTGVDLLWLWSPYLAFLGALLAVALESVLAPLVRARSLRVLIAALASCSALLLGYVLWGGVKEIWAAALAALLAALVPWTLERLAGTSRGGAVRALIPLAVGIGGLVCGLSLAGVVWAAPALAALAAGVAVARGHGRRIPVVLAGVVVAGAVLIPVVKLVPFVDALSNAPSSGPDWLGNLLAPIRLAQVGGIWPARDFRVDPEASALTALMLIAVAGGAGYGLWRAGRLRSWGVLAYAGVLGSAAVVLLTSGWAWGEGKALAIASPVPLALAGAGAAQLLARRGGLRIAGGALAVLLVVGVGWSYALQVQGTTLTPYDRHDELARIGERFAGRGPTLATEFDTYAGRWFLRRMDTEVASDLRRREVRLTDGSVLEKGNSADIDAFALPALDPYRLLVVRRSPAASRPPSSFQRVWRGRWYEVWERRPGRTVVEHLALGTPVDPAGVPACADVRRIARAAGPAGVVRAAVAAQPSVAGFDAAAAPRGWQATSGGVLYPAGAGTGSARATVAVPAAGRYEVWVGGAFRGGAAVAVDGVPVGEDRHQLSFTGNWVPFGTADLSAGPHAVTVRLDGGGLHPGTRGIRRYAIGPVALVPADRPGRVLELAPNDAGALCGRRLDWLEAVSLTRQTTYAESTRPVMLRHLRTDHPCPMSPAFGDRDVLDVPGLSRSPCSRRRWRRASPCTSPWRSSDRAVRGGAVPDTRRYPPWPVGPAEPVAPIGP